MGSESKPDAPESDASKSDGEDTLSLRSLMTLAGGLVGLNARDDLANLLGPWVVWRGKREEST